MTEKGFDFSKIEDLAAAEAVAAKQQKFKQPPQEEGEVIISAAEEYSARDSDTTDVAKEKRKNYINASMPEECFLNNVFADKLKNILKLPKDQKRGAIEMLKVEIGEYKEKWAIIKINAIEFLRNNPDAEVNDFLNAIIEKDAESGLKIDESEKKLAERVFFKYHNARKRAQVLINSLNKEELFWFVTGFPPKGNVDVSLGIANINFICENIDDYTSLYFHESDRSITDNERREANKSGGFKSGGPIIITVLKNIDAQGLDNIYIHEEQHVLMDLLDIDEKKDDLDFFKKTRGALVTGDEEKIENYLAFDLRRLRGEFEKRAKDEILAYSKTGRKAADISRILTKKEDKGGLYDYMGEYRKNWTKLWGHIYNFTDSQDIDIEPILAIAEKNRFKNVFQNTIKKVFETEYKEIIKNGLEALDRLSYLYDRETAISLVMNEPLSKWERTARLIADAKKEIVSKEDLKSYRLNLDLANMLDEYKREDDIDTAEYIAEESFAGFRYKQIKFFNDDGVEALGELMEIGRITDLINNYWDLENLDFRIKKYDINKLQIIRDIASHNYKVLYIHLRGLKSIDKDMAKIIADMPETVYFDDLERIDYKTARALTQKEGDKYAEYHFDSVKEISPDVLEILVNNTDTISLGIQELTSELAKVIANCRLDYLAMNNITTISQEVMATLRNGSGYIEMLELRGLRSVDPSIKKDLEKLMEAKINNQDEKADPLVGEIIY